MDTLRPATRHDLGVLSRAGPDATTLRRLHDDSRQRMVGTGFRCRAQREHFVRVPAGCREDLDDFEFPRRERSGLVENDRVDLRCPLHHLAATSQKPAPSQPSDCRHHGGWGGQDQRAGATYDQDGDGPTHSLRGFRAARQHVDRPCREQDGRKEVAGVAVSDPHHGSGPMVPGFFHEVDQSGQGRIVPGIGDPDVQQAVCVDGAREHFVAHGLVPRHRFSGNRTFVNGGLSPDDDAVRGDPLSRADGDHVVAHQILNMDLDFFAIPNDASVMRQLIDESVNRSFRAPGGPSLQTLAEKHDEHGLGGREVFTNRERGHRRDHNRQIGGNLPVEQLGDRTVERLVPGQDR